MAVLDLVVAIGILMVTMLPLAYSFAKEQRLARGYYYRAVAMEIIDGEMELLLAGEWRAFPAGRQAYSVRAEAATNLPPGHFHLSILQDKLQLEWTPGKAGQGGAVSRSARLPAVPRPQSGAGDL